MDFFLISQAFKFLNNFKILTCFSRLMFNVIQLESHITISLYYISCQYIFIQWLFYGFATIKQKFNFHKYKKKLPSFDLVFH